MEWISVIQFLVFQIGEAQYFVIEFENSLS